MEVDWPANPDETERSLVAVRLERLSGKDKTVYVDEGEELRIRCDEPCRVRITGLHQEDKEWTIPLEEDDQE